MDAETLNKKQKYLHNPCLTEKFTKNYLGNLNIYLDKKRYKDKIESLPSLQSTTITKLEKLIEREKNYGKNKNSEENKNNETDSIEGKNKILDVKSKQSNYLNFKL
jgi:hypothetical protein